MHGVMRHHLRAVVVVGQWLVGSQLLIPGGLLAAMFLCAAAGWAKSV